MSREGKSRGVSAELVVNGERRDVPGGSTLTALVQSLGLHPQAVAVELNGAIVKRARFSETVLEAGDRVEVVRFVQGGAACR